MALVDGDGDRWTGDDTLGWTCVDDPDAWAPTRKVLDLVWGPLYEEDE